MDSTERRDPDEQLEHNTEELDDRIQRLGENIEESRSQLQPRQEAADDPHVRDWGNEEEGETDDEGEQEETDDEDGGDPATFDDPEAIEDDEDA
ncbi:MAG TPA: hypothetical protein VGV40_07675 [Solirubrobacteraceae bacterium]|nr:hypothetical protein [Solirubrobacteraceae bacterium]